MSKYKESSDNPEADNAPFPLEHGVLDIELDVFQMAELHSATGEGLWHRLLRTER